MRRLVARMAVAGSTWRCDVPSGGPHSMFASHRSQSEQCPEEPYTRRGATAVARRGLRPSTV